MNSIRTRIARAPLSLDTAVGVRKRIFTRVVLALSLVGAATMALATPAGAQATAPGFTAAAEPAMVGTGTGLSGAYYDSLNFVDLRVIRTDPTVDFDWSVFPPDPSMSRTSFSVRWTGYVEAQFSEMYVFCAKTDDGVRLWVNNRSIVDHWHGQPATERCGKIELTAGVRYPVAMEYFQGGGPAMAQLRWQSASTLKQIIPMTQLYGPCPVDDDAAAYKMSVQAAEPPWWHCLHTALAR